MSFGNAVEKTASLWHGDNTWNVKKHNMTPLSAVKLYRNGKLELPITGLVEEFKCTKAGYDTHWIWRYCYLNSGPSGGSEEKVSSIWSRVQCKVSTSFQKRGWSSPTWESRPWAHPKSSLMVCNIRAEELVRGRRDEEAGGSQWPSRVNGLTGWI